MATVQAPRKTGQRLVLLSVSWKEYVRLLRTLAEHHVRLTYDRGVLELMTLSHEHESEGYFLGRMVDVFTEELNIPVKGGGRTTFKRRKRLKGLEPDNCWWIKNERLVRGKKKIDLRVDPAPDLALEVDIFHSSLNRLAIYAALGVTEIWRYDGKSLAFLELQLDGKYLQISESLAFPGLKPGDLMPFLAMRATTDETTVIRHFRAWVRQRFMSSSNP